MTLVDQYIVADSFIDAVRARTDLFPREVEWKTSIPQIMVLLSMNGSASTVHGIPPILAFI